MVTEETKPMLLMFYSCEKSISRKILFSPLKTFPSLVPPKLQNCNNTLLPNFFSVNFEVVAYGRLQKKKKNFKQLVLNWSRSLTRDGCLQEVPNIVICLGTFSYFGTLVAEER